MPSVAVSTSHRWRSENLRMRSNMVASMLVDGARLADVGLDDEASLGHVSPAGVDSLQHLHPFLVAPSELERHGLKDGAFVQEHDVPVAERLKRARAHRERNGGLLDQDLAAGKQPGTPPAIRIRQFDACQQGLRVLGSDG